jgi:putative membrane protein
MPAGYVRAAPPANGAVFAVQATMTRSSKMVLLVSISLPLSLFACSRDQDARSAETKTQAETGPDHSLTPASGERPAGTAADSPAAPAATDDTKTSDRLTDAQIIAVAAAVNAAEVDQAKIAVGRARQKAVKDFAQMMISHHGKAVKDVNELSTRLNLTPADSELVTRLRVDATETLTELQKESANDFDDEYIDAQIDMHETALKKLDEKLLPNVQNAELKSLLQTMRTQVADHLAKAKALDKSLD